MRTKFGALAAIIALVGLTASIITPASSNTRYHRQTLHVTDKASDGGEIFIDVGEEGDSAGDYIVIENKLYNAAGTKKVGEATGDCLLLVVLGECDLSFKLRGGLIVFEGPVNFAETSRLAVTGGTGRYKTAHGTVVATPSEQGFDFVIKLLL